MPMVISKKLSIHIGDECFFRSKEIASGNLTRSGWVATGNCLIEAFEIVEMHVMLIEE
jgi:hypothetical protein